ncbi:MAG: helix-turn-helix transcriptional regulator [Catenulispora sp.]|nr:helix-turn-helix transcriptional regulator [Catenulispora sp.]
MSDNFLPPGFRWLELARTRVPLLSEQQRAVFVCLAQGMSNAAIARETGRSLRTVKLHVSALMARLGVESRLQVGIVAFSVLFGSAEMEPGLPFRAMPQSPST